MILKKLVSIIGLGFGSGLSPIAPGTAGSFIAAGIYYFFIWDSLLNYLGIALFLFFIIVSFFIGILVCSLFPDEDEDPKSFVWDEFTGMWVSCIPLSFIDKNIYLLLLAFLIFRFFDIFKPLGIQSIDSRTGPFYVMIDDVIAGSYSAFLMTLIIFFI
tara:strand:+ start:712 stop:1185 length:474 start_codon:yes stop_codon:yes gene_type:complete